jgi:hypothetical protein
VALPPAPPALATTQRRRAVRAAANAIARASGRFPTLRLPPKVSRAVPVKRRLAPYPTCQETNQSTVNASKRIDGGKRRWVLGDCSPRSSRVTPSAGRPRALRAMPARRPRTHCTSARRGRDHARADDVRRHQRQPSGELCPSAKGNRAFPPQACGGSCASGIASTAGIALADALHVTSWTMRHKSRIDAFNAYGPAMPLDGDVPAQ